MTSIRKHNLSRLRVARVALFLLPVVLLGRVIQAELPGANSATAYTDKQFVLEELQYNRRRFVDTYNAVGSKNPAWDAQALAFLEQGCRYLNLTTQFPPFQPEILPTAAQIAAMGERLLAQKCDDAQVRYIYAIALMDLRRDREAVAQLKLVLAKCKEGKFPPESTASAAHRLWLLRSYLSADELAAVEAALEAGSIQMARGSRPFPTERLLLVIFAHEYFESDHAMEGRVCEAISKLPDADPWFVEMLQGKYEIALAWDARGSDLGVNVKPDGWKGFGEHLAEARKHLTKAWQLEPSIFDSANEMISVVMGDGGQGNETIRTWFDRALEAKFDCLQARNRMFWALRPRWGGSWEQMLALGRECAQTKRFDTTVPLWFVLAVQDIAADSADFGGPAGQVWTDESIYHDAEQVFQGYEQAMPAGRRRDWFVSWHAATAWRAGKPQEARRLLDQLTTPADVHGFRGLTESPEVTISKIYAFTGDKADAARQAADDLQASRFDIAAKEFRDLASQTADDDKSAFFFDEYATMLETRLGLDAGEWVNLIPKRGLHGWTIGQGIWSIDAKGRLVGKWDEGGLLLLSKADLGRRYEVNATLEYTSPKGRPAHIGFALDHDGVTYNNGVFYSTGDNRNGFATHVNRRVKTESAQYPQINTMQIATWDDRYTVTMNGKPMNVFEPPAPIEAPRSTPRLAIYAPFPQTDTTIYLSELKVRRLKEPPGH